jgi:hypothetical protein
MYRVSLAFVQLFSLYVQWFDLAIIEPVIVCFSSGVYSFSACIPSQLVYALVRCYAINSSIVGCNAVVTTADIAQPVLKRETSDFLQRSAYWDVFLCRMTVQELAVITNLVLFQYNMRCRTGHIACTIPF